MVFDSSERGVGTLKMIVFTRLMRWKKEWKSLLGWLLLPIIATLLVMQSVGAWQEETKVPIALVVEEKSEMAARLVEDIASTDLLQIHFLQLDDALHKLEQHELDSVFVIREGYEDNILANRRNQLIEAYSSNRSFAYRAVVETITSFAQQDASRTKAAFVIKQLFKDYGMDNDWSYSEIIANSQKRQQSEALLQSSFSFYTQEDVVESQSGPLLTVWGVWTLFAILTTFFLFDWVIQDNRPTMRPRWHFTRLSFKQYAFGSFWIYTGLLTVLDVVTVFLFTNLYQETVTITGMISLFTFRLTINLIAFLTATVFNQPFMYYVSGMAISLILVVIGGAFVPLEGVARKWPWVEAFSPVTPLLAGKIPFIWLSSLLIWLSVWMWKGEKIRAGSTATS